MNAKPTKTRLPLNARNLVIIPFRMNMIFLLPPTVDQTQNITQRLTAFAEHLAPKPQARKHTNPVAILATESPTL